MSLKLIMSFNMIKIHSTFDIGQFVGSSRRAIEELIEVFTYNLEYIENIDFCDAIFVSVA